MRFALLGTCLLALGGTSSSAENAWRQGAPLPVPRGEVAAATVGRELVVVGGFVASGESSSRVDAYSPARDRWRRLPDLPVAVNHAMAASNGRRLYVVGGYGAPRRAFVLSQGRWRRLPDLLQPRAAAGAAIVGRTLYVVGGIAGSGLARSTLAFDLKRRRWRSLPGPKPREHLGVSALGGRVYAVAGRKAGTNFDVVQAYVPGRRRWVSLPRLPEARGGNRLGCRGTAARVSGERVGRGHVRRRLRTRCPHAPLAAPARPADGEARLGCPRLSRARLRDCRWADTGTLRQ
jgi:hypothetical protein